MSPSPQRATPTVRVLQGGSRRGLLSGPTVTGSSRGRAHGSLGGNPESHPQAQGSPWRSGLRRAALQAQRVCTWVLRPGQMPVSGGSCWGDPVPPAGGRPGGVGAEVLKRVAHRGAPPVWLGQSGPGRSAGSGVQSQVSLPARPPGSAPRGLPAHLPGDCCCLQRAETRSSLGKCPGFEGLCARPQDREQMSVFPSHPGFVCVEPVFGTPRPDPSGWL